MDELIFILIYWGRRGAGEKQALGTDTLLGRTGGGQGAGSPGPVAEKQNGNFGPGGTSGTALRAAAPALVSKSVRSDGRSVPGPH